MVRVRALRDFISGVHGNITAGDKFTADDARAKHYLENGLVEMVQPDAVFSEAATHAPAPAAPVNEGAAEAVEGAGREPGPTRPQPARKPRATRKKAV